jgi:apolipoprotein N-acyltransferase
MRRLADRLRALTGWRRLVAAFGAGAFSVLALSPFDLWPLLFLTLPPLVWLIDGIVAQARDDRRRQLRHALATGWAFGFGYFTFGLYWIGKAFLVEAEIFAVIMPFAMTAMPAGLALFTAAAVTAAAACWRPGFQRLLLLAASLAAADWLRGHILTGFPWNLFGQVFIAEAGLSQLLALAGPYALSLLGVLAFTTPALLADAPAAGSWWRRNHAPLAGALALLLAASLWGHLRLAAGSRADTGITLRIVQPNIPQQDKWKPGNAGPIYRTMLRLSGEPTAERPAGLAGVRHLIWPESALPFFLDRSQEALTGIDELLPDDVDLILGAERYEAIPQVGDAPPYRVFNSLMVLDGKANIVTVFDKKHLVPFGEYLPFQSTLEAIGLQQLARLRGGFAMGGAHRLVELPDIPPFSPLICYEVAFPGEVVEPGARPQWLINVTNDAWYGVSTGPYQHLAQSRMRAIETGLPLVRAANTGISAVIDPYGRILHSLPLASAGIIDATLPQAIDRPPYARIGDLGFGLLLVLALTLGCTINTPPLRVAKERRDMLE